jgi:hypothetical protein
MFDENELRQFNALRREVAELGRKMDFLFRHLAVTFVDERPPPDEVEQMLIAGDKIGAIRVYRALHGAGLREAKEAVEELAARLGV